MEGGKNRRKKGKKHIQVSVFEKELPEEIVNMPFEKSMMLSLGSPSSTSENDQSIIESRLTGPAYGKAKKIAEGGLGIIEKIKDLRTGRIVARKVPKSNDAQSLLDFIHEGEIAANLSHPNILSVYEIGIDKNGKVFITMPLVENDQAIHIKTLKDVVESRDSEVKKQFGEKELIEIMINVCNALVYAHEKLNIIHLDIKPENIMIGSYGQVYLMDWGLAREIDENSTEPLTISGTPAFMSPEQAICGEVKTLNEKTDVYILGATLFNLFSRRLPVTAKSLKELLDKIIQGKINHLPTGLSNELKSIILKAMSLSQEDRYASVELLKRDLQCYLRNEPVSTIKYSQIQRLSKWYTRNKLMAITISSAVIIIGLISIYYVIDLKEKRDTAELALRRFEEEKSLRLESERDNAPIWYKAAIDEAKLKKLDEALKHVTKAVELSGGKEEYQIFKGELLIYQQDFIEASRIFDVLHKNNLENEDLKFLKNFCSAVLLKPNDPLENYRYQQYLIREGKPYLSRVKNRDLEYEAFREYIFDLYPNVKISRRIDHKNKQRFTIDGLEQIEDLSVLKGWPLDKLDFNSSTIENFDILKELDFSRLIIYNKTVDINEVLKGKKLDYLHLYNVKGFDPYLTVVEDMPLKTVLLENVDVDLSSFKNTPLENIKLRYFKKIDFSPLEGKELNQVEIDFYVKSRSLSSEQLKKINPKLLMINKVIFDDLSFLAEMKDLYRLEMTNCDIHDQKGFEDFRGEHLLLAGTKVTNYDYFKDLKNLKFLALSQAISEELKKLGSLNMKSLALLSSPVEDISVINNYKNLDTLVFLPSKKNLNWISNIKSFPKLKVSSSWNDKEVVSVDEFIENYFEGKYLNVSQELKNKYQKREKVIAAIKKSNPKFIDNAQIQLEINDDLSIDLLSFNKLPTLKNVNTSIDLRFLKEVNSIRSLAFKGQELKNSVYLKYLKNTNKISFLDMKLKNETLKYLPKELPLENININNTNLESLDNFQNENLKFVNIGSNPHLESIEALNNMKELNILNIFGLPKVNDLSPLEKLNIKSITLDTKQIRNKKVEPLRKIKTLKKMTVSHKDYSSDEFWKKYDAGEF